MKEIIAETVTKLSEGAVICYPTDTIWGLGCDAKNNIAVKKLFALKQRPENLPFVVLVGKIEQLYSIFPEIPEMAYDLLELSDDPITLVLDGAKNVSPLICAKDGSLAVRMVKGGFAKELCLRFKGPVVSTSANIHGEAAPKNLEQISPDILAAVDYTVNLPLERGTGKASSIIRLKADGQVQVLRN